MEPFGVDGETLHQPWDDDENHHHDEDRRRDGDRGEQPYDAKDRKRAPVCRPEAD
jgi:hypothetical protein